ncbi:hypothetical protein AB1N83_005073 [Pleurotus pulmonarius]
MFLYRAWLDPYMSAGNQQACNELPSRYSFSKTIRPADPSLPGSCLIVMEVSALWCPTAVERYRHGPSRRQLNTVISPSKGTNHMRHFTIYLTKTSALESVPTEAAA